MQEDNQIPIANASPADVSTGTGGGVRGQELGVSIDPQVTLPPTLDTKETLNLLAELLHTDSKSLLRSKTIWGVVVLLLPHLARLFGWQMDSAEAQAVVDSGVSLLGAILGVWGRFTASRPLHLLTPRSVPLALFLAALSLSGCGSATTVYNGAGRKLLCVRSNAATLKFHAADGTTLEETGIDNATPTTATGNAIAGGIKAAGENGAGILVAAGASKLFSPIK